MKDNDIPLPKIALILFVSEGNIRGLGSHFGIIIVTFKMSNSLSHFRRQLETVKTNIST